MNNKDFTYLMIFLIIFLSAIISQKKSPLPEYTRTFVFDIVMLINILLLLHINIYIGVFIVYTYLLIKIKNQ